MATIDGYPVGIREEDAHEQFVTGGATVRPLAVMLGPSDMLWPGLLSNIKGATGLPAYGTKARDQILRGSVLVDGTWSSAVNMALTKTVALGYRLTDSTDSQRKLGAAKDLLDRFDGAWTRGLARGMRDYLTTNAGQYIGIERVARAPGAKIRAIFHLDSLRCYPTGWPEYPVLYFSPKGTYHLLADYDVLQVMDMPSPDDRYPFVGQCAGDRAWETILMLAALKTYFREKVSGTRNLAIHIVTGISDTQLRQALMTSDEQRTERGFVLYKGSTIIPMLSDQTPGIVTIPLAEIPDGFQVVDERRDAYLNIANAIGMAVQELQPLSGQGLGTGTQSLVLDEAAEGRGLAYYRKALMEGLNARVLPASTTVAFDVNDLRDQKLKAETQLVRAQWATALVEKGLLSAAQGLNLLSDAGDIPPEFLAAQDLTPGGSVSDDEKLVEAPQRPALPSPPPAPILPPSPPPSRATKAARRAMDATDVLIDDALAEALGWVRTVTNRG